MSDCPTPDLLARFAQGSLPATNRIDLAEHVRTCESCRAMVEPLRVSQQATLPIALDTNPVLERGTAVGRYQILELIGSGAMGYVYEAVDPQLDRKVALKLLRAKGASEEHRARLLREAQAMARLAHPNVVQIFDAGATDAGDVFLAMERIDGTTLTEWCRTRRPFREVLRYFVFAGRGLAAAHSAGLVHRDFKPDNVLVARDGRVRVTDFGLVRAAPSGEGLDDGPLSGLTRDGALLGTPNYMSPEQLEGRPVDARSDQFSFCVALHEALYGERPFAARRLHELVTAIRDGQVREAPERSAIPSWVRRALMRGLSYDPAARYPSMEALFGALAADPARRWRQLATVAALVLAGAGLVGTVEAVRHSTAVACADAGRSLSTVWNDAARDRLARAFSSVPAAYATELRTKLDARLDAYAGSWTHERIELCRATRVRHELSDASFAVRNGCLDLRRQELAAFVKVLGDSDAHSLEHAIDAVDRLRPAAECATADASAPRASADEQLHPAEVEALQQALADSQAQLALGRIAEATKSLDAAAPAAPHLAATPLAASVALVRGRIDQQRSVIPEARRELHQAVTLAERFADDRTAVSAWIELGMVETDAAKYDEADQAFELADAKATRLGEAAQGPRHYLRSARAREAVLSGRYADAVKQLQTLLEEPAASATSEASERENLGTALRALGRDDEARLQFEKAISLRELAQGPRHPDLARPLSEIGMLDHHRGDDVSARALLTRSISTLEAAYGPDSATVAPQLNNLAIIEGDDRQFDAALALNQRVERIKVQAYGEDHPSVALTLINESDTLYNLNRYAEADAALQRAIAILSARKPVHPNLIAAYSNLGAIQRMERHLDASAATYRQALALGIPAMGADHAWVAFARQGLGETLLAIGRSREAQRELEQALATQEKLHATPEDLAETQYLLAKALWASGPSHARARSLAQAALAGLTGMPDQGNATRAEIAAWLAHHGGPAH